METENGAESPQPTPGAKMLYLIKRRSSTSREELIAHWFANHMPAVIAAQKAQADAGRVHASRYVATVFSPNRHGANPWDGMAQLWFDRPLPTPSEPHGTKPVDSFQERAEPYVPWATTEYVVTDPTPHLDLSPLTLNPPFPCTRSGFHKVSFLVKARPGTDFDQLYRHWLTVHAPNVSSVLDDVGGFGYLVSQSIDPERETYAGLAELYFHDEAGWAEYRNAIAADGMEEWVDGSGTLVLPSGTEMIGIP
ncbi:MAG: EthD domain-containing protein [Acidimicrobiia bacterium]|nr:EthD domain-containing protein [Acidimicrobiia bacterium]